MQWLDHIRRVKVALLIAALAIVAASLVISHQLVSDLKREEVQKMAIWAEAMRSLNQAGENTDLNLVLKVLGGNHTIPIVVTDREGHVVDHRNIHLSARTAADSLAQLEALAASMRREGDTMRISLAPDSVATAVGEQPDYITICYAQSSLLTRLSYYPYVQMAVMLVFVLIAILALLSWKKAEQNKVWVGLSKETAHQLGTPISSLMAWVEMWKESYPDDPLLPELQKDVDRLQLVAHRFSKIGSIPEPQPADLGELVQRVADYMQRRTSSHIVISTDLPATPLVLNMNSSLFEWVIENLCKNAVDAMPMGQGKIEIKVSVERKVVAVEVHDTGKGIPKNHFKSVFAPGFTTKKRGWGLGLSLAKRIVEEYHHGRIFVKSSEPGHGTTFRIELSRKLLVEA